MQYWVVYALLTVVESAISAAYWFRKFWILFPREQGMKMDSKLTRYTAFYYIFKFVLILWMSLPQTK